MSPVTWILIISGVTLNAGAQLLLKVATRPLAHLSGFDLTMAVFSARVLMVSAHFWGGMACYGLSVCVWLAALSKAPVSTAYPSFSSCPRATRWLTMLSSARRTRRLRDGVSRLPRARTRCKISVR